MAELAVACLEDSDGDAEDESDDERYGDGDCKIGGVVHNGSVDDSDAIKTDTRDSEDATRSSDL